jgi:adenylate cyclase
LGLSNLLESKVDRAVDYLVKSGEANPRIWYVQYYLAGALGLKGDIEGAKAALAQSLKLNPKINSIAAHDTLLPWYESPKMRELEQQTLNEGLRRIGFPEK